MKLQIKNAHAAAGFTLVELLIALALSAMLSAAVARIVMGNRQNVQLTDSFAKVQESSRYAMDYLVKDFRMAGYMGCVNSNVASGGKITNTLSTADTAYTAALNSYVAPIRAIDNYDPANTAKTTLFSSITSSTIKPVTGSDVFISTGALATDITTSAVASNISNSFTVLGPANQVNANVLAPGSILMLTDCNTAHIFSVSYVSFPTTTTANIMHATSVTPGIDNLSAFLALSYNPGSQVLLMNTMMYYIGKSTLIPTPTYGTQINSLYRASTLNGGVPEELVPYVEDMQLTYGVDTTSPLDHAPDVYKTAAQIATDGDDMAASVYSVKITLVVSGDVKVGAPAQSGFVNDGKMRKSYTRLVNIRNAGLATY